MSYQAPQNGFHTFVYVWASQSVSVIGTALTLFAINIWLAQVLYPLPEQKPQLAWAFTALNLSHFLPTILVTPLAGATADRLDRKRIMMVTDGLNGLVSLTLAYLLWTHQLQFPTLLAIAMVSGVVGAFHGSAFDTAYAMLVPDHQLPRANGMMQTMWSLSNILAPGLAASLISLPVFAAKMGWGGPLGAFLAGMTDGTPLAIALDGVTFLLAGCVLLFLTVPSPKRADLTAVGGKPKRSILADMRQGLLYVWRRRPMLWLLGTFALVNLLTQLGIIMPLMVKFNLAADWKARGFTYETALALLNTTSSMGALAAGFLLTMWGGLKRHRVFGVVVPLLVVGLLMAAFGLSRWIYVSTVIGILIGMVFPVANVHSQAIWQSQVPRELQGRVFSVRRVIAQGLGPVGMTLAGLLTGRFDPGVVLTVFGVILTTFCFLQLFNPHLLRVEDKEYLDRMADKAALAAGD